MLRPAIANGKANVVHHDHVLLLHVLVASLDELLNALPDEDLELRGVPLNMFSEMSKIYRKTINLKLIF